jgi:hypothetical protein
MDGSLEFDFRWEVVAVLAVVIAAGLYVIFRGLMPQGPPPRAKDWVAAYPDDYKPPAPRAFRTNGACDVS